jgi:hypothetical protein
MSRYGNFLSGAPDYTKDIAALKDLLEKKEITDSEYKKEISRLQKERLTYIVRTNGGHNTSKKAIKEYNKLIDKISEGKQKQEAYRTLQERERFVKEMSESYEKKEAKEVETLDPPPDLE